MRPKNLINLAWDNREFFSDVRQFLSNDKNVVRTSAEKLIRLLDSTIIAPSTSRAYHSLLHAFVSFSSRVGIQLHRPYRPIDTLLRSRKKWVNGPVISVFHSLFVTHPP